MPALSDITNLSTGTTNGSACTNPWANTNWGSPVLHPVDDWANLDYIFPAPNLRAKCAEATNQHIRGELDNWLNDLLPTPSRDTGPIPSDDNRNPFGWFLPTTNLNLLTQLTPSPDLFRVPVLSHQVFEEQHRLHQLLDEPELCWHPGPQEYDRAHTLDDLFNWPEVPPRYQERPGDGEHILVAAQWDPYPVYECPHGETPTQRCRANH